MAQPDDRKGRVPPAGDINAAAGEFWVSNPWLFPEARENLSAYEPNRTWLGVDGQRFLDVTYVSNADSEGDGRASVAVDFNRDGTLDLFVRQVGGGPLILYENHFPKKNFVAISLMGTRSNRRGIGARITIEAQGNRQVRELFPGNTFLSQQLTIAHFGLGDATKIDRIRVRWPSGLSQDFLNVAANAHWRLVEGDNQLHRVAR